MTNHPNDSKKNPTNVEEIYSYRTEALADLCVKHDIKQRQIMRAFGYTNASTVKRWMAGEDIYINSLMKLCSAIEELDPLNFIAYKGHTFTTTLDLLARAEEAGIDLGKILANNNGNILLPTEKEPTYKEQLEDYKYMCSLQKEVIAVLREQVDGLKEEVEKWKRKRIVAPKGQ